MLENEITSLFLGISNLRNLQQNIKNFIRNQWRQVHSATSPQPLSTLYMQFSAILNAALYAICCSPSQKRLSPAPKLLLTATTRMNGAHPHYVNYSVLVVLLARSLPCYWVTITSVSEPPSPHIFHSYHHITVISGLCRRLIFKKAALARAVAQHMHYV